MKILFLTQYFPPEVGAPQNRIFEMAKQLSVNGHKIKILTGMPNYPGGRIFNGYRFRLFKKEVIDSLIVYRTWLYVKKTNNFILRLFNYFSFTGLSFIYGLFLSGSDIIIVESPPLFLGITGYLLSRIKRMRFVFNISDLWPESAVKLGILHNQFLIRFAYFLEMFLYKKADFITVQTEGIYRNIINRGISADKIDIITNGVDLHFLKPEPKNKEWLRKLGLKNEFIVGYAGNHGIAQNLETIVESAQQIQKNKNIRFLLVGDGPEKKRILRMISEKKLKNIITIPVQKKQLIPQILSVMDVCVVPLKKIDLFLGAIPSKMLEYMSAGKPILLGVQGEAEEILRKAKGGLCYEPENAHELTEQIQWLYKHKKKLKEFSRNAHQYIVKNFDRRLISKKLEKIFFNIIK